MSEASERLLVRIDATTEQLRRELKRAETALSGTQRTIDAKMGGFRQSFAKANAAITETTTKLQGFAGVAAGLITGVAIKRIADYSDKYQSLQGQLKLVTDSQEELNQVYARGLKLANETGQTTESTINLYARLARSTEELALTQDELFTVTQAVNQSFIVSGASAQEADSAILQLSQGMASGVLRGEELNSVMENSPRLSRALADGLGVSIGQLRQLGADGELTAEKVTGALLKMSDSINADFEKMPMTIGRATQKMQNMLGDMFGSVDAGPMIEAVEGVQKLISDPSFQKSIAQMTAALIKFVGWTGKALAGLTNFANFIGEELAARIHGVAADDLPRLTMQIRELEAEATRLEKRTSGRSQKAKELREEIKKLYALVELYTPAVAETVIVEEKAAKSLEKVAVATEQLNEVVVTATRHEYELADAVKETVTATEDLSIAATESAEAVSTAWSSSRDILSGFFFEIAADGKNAFDTLVDGFKAMIAKMVAEAAANQIFLGIGGLAGGMGLSSAASAATAAGGGTSLMGMGGSLLSGAKSIYAGGLGSLAGGYQYIGQQLGGAGFHGAAGSAYNAAGQYTGGLGSSLGNLGLNLGAGFAGNYLGSQVYGNTSGIGSMIGGLGGSVFGPLGTGAGAFLGGAAERVLGNALGFGGKGGNQAGAAEFNLATGSLNAYGIGNKFDQANVDAAGGMASMLQAFAGIVGGSSLSGRIKVGNRSGIKMDGTQYDDPEAFFDAMFSKILDGATNLDSAMKELVRGFDGTAEQTMLFAESVLSLNEASGINSVTQALQDYNAEQPTMLQGYNSQVRGIQKMIEGFDGSAQSAADLNAALLTNKAASYEAALAIQAITDQVRGLATDQAASIRESVMSQEELRASRMAERNALRGSLGSMVDPAKIAETSARILELNRQVFDSLSEAGQMDRAEEFAQFAERTGEQAERRLDRQLEMMEQTEEGLNAAVESMLGAATTNSQAADTQLEAAHVFGEWVQRLVAGGGGPTSGLATEVI